MLVLIFGSEGFIGSHLVKHFSTAGYTVHGCDLIELQTQYYQYFKLQRNLWKCTNIIEEIFQNNSYYLCINAAGSGSVPLSMKAPLDDFNANTVDTFQILNILRKHNADCRYINLSSAAVYGNPISLPVQENHPVQPLSPYGWQVVI